MLRERWIEQTVDGIIAVSGNNVQETEKILEEIRVTVKKKIEKNKGIFRPVFPLDLEK